MQWHDLYLTVLSETWNPFHTAAMGLGRWATMASTISYDGGRRLVQKTFFYSSFFLIFTSGGWFEPLV